MGVHYFLNRPVFRRAGNSVGMRCVLLYLGFVYLASIGAYKTDHLLFMIVKGMVLLIVSYWAFMCDLAETQRK